MFFYRAELQSATMNTNSHITIGKTAAVILKKKGIMLDKSAFVFGNVQPDFTPKLLVEPHVASYCEVQIKKRLASILNFSLTTMNRFSTEQSRELGCLCHFIADYFCFAHNAQFTKGTIAHAIYEAKLHKRIRSYAKSVKHFHFMTAQLGFTVSTEQNIHLIFKELTYLKSLYNASATPFYADFFYAVYAIVTVITNTARSYCINENSDFYRHTLPRNKRSS